MDKVIPPFLFPGLLSREMLFNFCTLRVQGEVCQVFGFLLASCLLFTTDDVSGCLQN